MSTRRFTFDKTAIHACTWDDAPDTQDTVYWHSRTPEERWAAMELMRQLNYPGYDPATARISRVLEVVECP